MYHGYRWEAARVNVGTVSSSSCVLGRRSSILCNIIYNSD